MTDLEAIYDDFYSKWAGKPCDYDGKYGNQCTDYAAKEYTAELFDIVVGSLGDAADIWIRKKLTKYYIRHSATAKAKKGWLAVWSRKFAPGTGHIAIVHSDIQYMGHKTISDQTQVFVSEQDGRNPNGVVQVKWRPLDNLLGYLEPRAELIQYVLKEKPTASINGSSISFPTKTADDNANNQPISVNLKSDPVKQAITATKGFDTAQRGIKVSSIAGGAGIIHAIIEGKISELKDITDHIGDWGWIYLIVGIGLIVLSKWSYQRVKAHKGTKFNKLMVRVFGSAKRAEASISPILRDVFMSEDERQAAEVKWLQYKHSVLNKQIQQESKNGS